MSLTVSVIVPTYKRPDLLLRCLEAVMAQEFEPGDYEILVVDNAASEETRRAVEAWVQEVTEERYAAQAAYEVMECREHRYASDGLPADTVQREILALLPEIPIVRYVPANGRRGPAAARNCGWRSAVGDIIAFTDDDCIPDPEWLRSGVQAIEAGLDGAYGRIIVPLPSCPTDYELDATGLERSEFITANCFYRRSVMEAAGGFDERFTMAWREDSDLYFTLQEEGYALAQVESALVYHPVRPAAWGISLHQQKKAQFNALLYKKHPRFYREKIQKRPPWHYYIAVAGLLAALVGLFLQKPDMALAGFGAWFLATGAFCYVRLKNTSHRPSHILEMVITSILIPPMAVYWRLRGAVRFRVPFV